MRTIMVDRGRKHKKWLENLEKFVPFRRLSKYFASVEMAQEEATYKIIAKYSSPIRLFLIP
jgi:hypothetical protein